VDYSGLIARKVLLIQLSLFSTGANPSLTIAAFADRVAAHMRDVDDAPWPEVRTP